MPDGRRYERHGAGQTPGIGFESVVIAVQSRQRYVDIAVAPSGIRPRDRYAGCLFVRPQQASSGQRSFRGKQVAVCPACVGTQALPCSIACAARNGARRCRFLPHKQVGIRRSIWRAALAWDRFNRYRRQQARGDERRAQIVNFAAVIQVAGRKTPQYRDMVGVKSRGALGPQLPEIAACARFHGQAVVANAPVAIEKYVPLADLCERIAVFG